MQSIVCCYVVLSEKLAIPFLPRCPPLWVWEVLSTFLWSPVWLGFLDLLCSRLLSLGGKLSIPVLYLPSILLTLLEFVVRKSSSMIFLVELHAWLRLTWLLPACRLLVVPFGILPVKIIGHYVCCPVPLFLFALEAP